MEEVIELLVFVGFYALWCGFARVAFKRQQAEAFG
jgi:hypothetical protein